MYLSVPEDTGHRKLRGKESVPLWPRYRLKGRELPGKKGSAYEKME